MCSSYQLKFSASKNKKLNKKENNGDSRSFKQTDKEDLSIFYTFFLEGSWLLYAELHALDLFGTFAFIRHNFALILYYFFKSFRSKFYWQLNALISRCTHLSSRSWLFASGNWLPKDFSRSGQRQKYTKDFQNHESFFWRPSKELSGCI